ncbi:MAG: phycobilisome linker polypeptide [Trichodesmium sp. St16_bin4-tuft]|uniref:Phycobilisome linker polypeptide n=1 Tax=Trichodesmium erythraeum (strain IMS101) TaxID=203124 RepID=Q10XB2_TRIEI|nr:phycobilisome linker polypeptide [Trichodesmium erythraeum GBRTRLIN201]MCH2050589.1 phycobilisome linker polypeptide [Trichodesmium sp. ALOHA_ZT_67]MDE5069970.1 phycobilisome linker polypeptide [Trichodesmium sp. St4_bin8_1]MDE5070552.1 phycobilisome linker polypeptide [Trichodesmium sp. St5_bin8]MDE5091558.1 phycobilisome linker polypeptide [Trichodesmium sp. St18_bin3_1_1]MDE5092941.1 phycobilisome linker polypeptide [Trichodesmium sp. St11_bin5]MDE5101079.1 phycobilisome linker polypept
MVFGPASQLGVSLFEDTEPVELLPGRSSEEIETVIRAVYKQVLGNAYVMESERLTVPESKLKEGTITVREFVRQVGRSDLYRSRFFDPCPRYRSVELNFKHFLGRAPDGYDEMKLHSNLLDEGSFEADIDSYIDSDEYSSAYGENIVPYYRGYKTQTGKKMVGFTHIFQLLRGASSSDLKGSLSGNSPALNKYVIQETPLAVVPPSGGSDGWSFQDTPLGARSRHGVGASSSGKVYRVEVTAYRSKVVNRVSRFRRSNQVFLVPFDQLSKEYQRIHRQGGVIASITPIS